MLQRARIIKSIGNRCIVHLEKNQQQYICTIKGNFRIKGSVSTNPVAVGDWVEVLLNPNAQENNTNQPNTNSQGTIVNLLERENCIVRKSVNLSKQSHVLAANVQQAALMVTLANPVTTTVFIDRFLIAANAYNVPVVIIFNKVDLYNKSLEIEANKLIDTYEKIGYSCLKLSLQTNAGLEALQNLLTHKTTCLIGHSGVGKTTMLNTLNPNLQLKTENTSKAYELGQHVTTFAEMYHLPKLNAWLIDLPGIKGLEPFDIAKDEVALQFPEMFKLLNNCQYYNCTHLHEPGCAVKKACEEGLIAQTRYQSYVNIINSNNGYRKK